MKKYKIDKSKNIGNVICFHGITRVRCYCRM